MSDYVRVKVDGPDHEITISQDQYDAQPDAFKVLDKPAVDNGGVPIPPKHKTTASAEAEKKATSRASTTTTSTEAAEKADQPAVKKEN